MQTSLLALAKRVLSRQSSTIAATMVPFVALTVSVVPASAQITQLDTSSCTATGVSASVLSGGTCAAVQESSADSGGLLGVKIYTENNDFEPGSVSVQTSAGSGGTFGLELSAGGGVNGSTFSGSIPLSWDFSVTTSDGGDFSYQLTYSLNTGAGAQAPAGTSSVGIPGTVSFGSLSNFANASGSTIGGVGTLSIPTTLTVIGWSATLHVEEQGSSGQSTLTLNVPTNSIDFATPAAPEPGSVILFGGGLGWLMLRRRRVTSAD